VEAERKIRFTHSNNDAVNWDAFNDEESHYRTDTQRIENKVLHIYGRALVVHLLEEFITSQLCQFCTHVFHYFLHLGLID
jgi:hypothetical protein